MASPGGSSRRILDASKFEPGFASSDVTIVNWPQNDYWFGRVLGVDAETRDSHLEEGRQLSLSLFYWLQTEAPRPDGGGGYPGLRLRGDVVGGKNLGVTHITNGAFRVHPVDWSVGEAAGYLAAFCLERRAEPRAVRNKPALLHDFQALLVARGVELSWPRITPM